MKINKFYLIATMLFFFSSNAQISKGNWMMGGDAKFSHNNNTSYGSTTKATVLAVSPNVGYFFIDKLAIGTSGDITFTFTKNGNSTTDSSYFSYGIGPFARYYFLEKEKEINIFSEISYSIHKINETDSKLQNFNIKAGAVYFLNSSVGFEVALNYLNQKLNEDGKNNAVFLSVGFQIHLEKE